MVLITATSQTCFAMEKKNCTELNQDAKYIVNKDEQISIKTRLQGKDGYSIVILETNFPYYIKDTDWDLSIYDENNICNYQFPDKKSTIQAIYEEASRQGFVYEIQKAYILATIDYETHGLFEPLKEKHYMSEDWRKRHCDDWPFYARGFIPIKSKYMYESLQRITKLSLIDNPEIITDPSISCFVAICSLKRGLITGNKLIDYINAPGIGNLFCARKCLEHFEEKDEEACGIAQTIADKTFNTWIPYIKENL